MKTILDDQSFIDKLMELIHLHKSYVLENMEDVDSEVENQKSRFYKFWCWLKYGHLLKKNKIACSRCGKVLTNKTDATKNR